MDEEEACKRQMKYFESRAAAETMHREQVQELELRKAQAETEKAETELLFFRLGHLRALRAANAGTESDRKYMSDQIEVLQRKILYGVIGENR